MALLEEIWMATLGGMVLGVSTSIYLAVVGRITGMSGTLRSSYAQITLQKKADPLHLVYLGGLVLGGVGLRYVYPSGFEDGGYGSWLMFSSGCLVGLGTTIGHGCTSGHGLCGLARWSKRSFAAVVTFFATALVVATSLSGIMGKEWVPTHTSDSSTSGGVALGALCVGASLVVYGGIQLRQHDEPILVVSALGCALLFSLGLCISGMLKPTKIHAFLILDENWDPSLAFVMGGGVFINIIAWPLILAWASPLGCDQWDLPEKTELENDIFIGAFIFGVGWALGGLCPGPGIVGIGGRYGTSMLIWILGCLTGDQIAMLLPFKKSTLKNDIEDGKKESSALM